MQKTWETLMLLITGKYFRRKKWIELPTPNWVVERVHFIGQKQDQMWTPGGVTIVAMNKRGDNTHAISSDMD